MVRSRKQKIERSSDEIREIILKFFYEVHKRAATPKKMRLKISEVKSSLKDRGLKSNEIISNLEYLIQTGWILKEEETTQIRTKKGLFPSKATYYKASDQTVNYFEGASRFQRVEKSYSGINITNIQGVVTLGDENTIVNVQYPDLYRELALLSGVIRKSSPLSDEEKLNYTSEIETIKAQLSKTQPDRDIISKSWERLRPLATVAGIASFFEKVGILIGGLV